MTQVITPLVIGIFILMAGRIVFRIIKNIIGLMALTAGFILSLMLVTTAGVNGVSALADAGKETVAQMQEGTKRDYEKMINPEDIAEMQKYLDTEEILKNIQQFGY